MPIPYMTEKEILFSTTADWIDYTKDMDYTSENWQLLLRIPLMTEQECADHRKETSRIARKKIREILAGK